MKDEIHLNTYRELLDYNRTLVVHCAACGHRGPVNLASLILLGHGNCRWRGAAFLCTSCGHTSTDLHVQAVPPSLESPSVGA
jgi:hypothetical protein